MLLPALPLCVKLPASSAYSRMVKGAYLAVHPRADSQTQDKARQLWQEAASTDESAARLLPFLSETYTDLLPGHEAKP